LMGVQQPTWAPLVIAAQTAMLPSTLVVLAPDEAVPIPHVPMVEQTIPQIAALVTVLTVFVILVARPLTRSGRFALGLGQTCDDKFYPSQLGV
jgi:hypothetical protein